MTLIGWLADAGNADGTKGGAELTQEQFKQAAPDHVEVIDCPPGDVKPGLDTYCLHNIVGYSLAELPLKGWKYHHDVGPHIRPEVWDVLRLKFRHICVSPKQRDYLNLEAELVPPIIPLERFREAAENAGERKGAVALGPWMNHDKTPHAAAQWAKGNGGIDFFGGGPFAPPGSVKVDYEDLPELLARYKTFVHLPRTLDPCPRGPIEAWAAGCEVVMNRLVGSRYWIEEAPDELETAALSFWSLVLGDA